MHEFSVNHTRTTNVHNTLSAQSDQPPEIPLPFINCFVSSGSQASVYLCILGIFNRNIWNANSNGSGQTCDVQSHQDICRSLKLKICPKILMTSQKTGTYIVYDPCKKLYHKFTIYLKVKYCKQYRPGERCLVMKYLDLHCCLCFIYRTFRHNVCMSFKILAKPLTILEFQTKLFAQSEHLPMK